MVTFAFTAIVVISLWLFLFYFRFDLKNANINDDNWDKISDKSLPDVVSVFLDYLS